LALSGSPLIVALYVSVLVVVIRSLRLNPGAYLLAPFALAFPLANLLDWPWHLLGAGVVWAVTVGGVSLYLTAPSAATRRSGLERV